MCHSFCSFQASVHALSRASIASSIVRNWPSLCVTLPIVISARYFFPDGYTPMCPVLFLALCWGSFMLVILSVNSLEKILQTVTGAGSARHTPGGIGCTRHIPGTVYYLMSYVLCLMSYVLCLMSYVLCLMSYILYLISYILYLISYIRLRLEA